MTPNAHCAASSSHSSADFNAYADNAIAISVGATSGKEQAACLSSADYWCNRSRHCVPVEARCNGMLECALGDDEAGCPTGITPQTASQLETTRPMLSKTAGRLRTPHLLEHGSSPCFQG